MEGTEEAAITDSKWIQEALKSQAEAQQKKNELDMQEAQGKAEVAAIEEMQNNDSSGFSPTYDPYKGHLHFEW